MNLAWTINGVSFASLGILNASFSWVNSGVGTCTLRLVDDGAPVRAWPKDYRAEIKLDNEMIFIGWVHSTAPGSGRGDEGITVTLGNALRWFKNTLFSRDWVDYPNIQKVATGGALFEDANGNLISLTSQMGEVMRAAWTGSGGAMLLELPPCSTTLQPQPEYVSAITCLEAALKVGRWSPSDVLFCDDSGGFPVVKWAPPGTRASHSFTRGTQPLTDAQLSAVQDLAISAVVIRFEFGHSDKTYTANTDVEISYPAGCTARTPGALVVVLPTSQYTTAALDWAQQVYTAIRSFAYDGTLVTEGTFKRILPGDLVQLRGRPEWEDSTALVQSVDLDAATLRQTVQMGPPKHLGVTELADLYWYNNTGGTAASKADTTHTSFEFYTETVATLGLCLIIAPGSVSDAKNEKVPIWNNGTRNGQLDLQPQPAYKMPLKFSKAYYLKVRWRPDLLFFSGTDELGVEVSAYTPASTGEIVTVEIVNYRANNIAPYVPDRATRAVDGTFYFKLATVSRDYDEIKITQHKSGDLKFHFVPPNNLFCVSNG